MTKEFWKEYMKIQNKEEITFEKYWKKVNEIITTIEIPKNTKIQENLNKFIDKITNKFIQKELIRYLLDHCEYSEFEVEIEKVERTTTKARSIKTKQSGKSRRKSISEIREKQREIKTYQQRTKENERYEEFIKEYIPIIGKYKPDIFIGTG